jgi:small subunit ribosomal protein S20
MSLEIMANIKSAKKRILQTEKKSEVNRGRRSDMRTQVKLVEKAIESGDVVAAKDALKTAEPKLMRSAQKSLLHRNRASRKISRLSKKIKSIET